MRRIDVVSVARSDYNIYLPILKKLKSSLEFELRLIVAGVHLLPEYGNTVALMEEAGFAIRDRVPLALSEDNPFGMARSGADALAGFADCFARDQPDMLMVLGDRYEMLAAAYAALPFRIPVAHVHGGERTSGAIDDSVRHAMTKMSHLHFASTEAYATRIRQLGEEDWRVVVSGAPFLDNLRDVASMPSYESVAQKYDLIPDEAPILVAYHPTTLELDSVDLHVRALLEVLDTVSAPLILTAPNSDAGSAIVRDHLMGFARRHPRARYVVNFALDYYAVLAASRAMVGNSSSAIIEAPSFKLPVVNIGSRQDGRVRAPNVIDVGTFATEIAAGLEKALSSQFRSGLETMSSPYAQDEPASDIILNILRKVPLDQTLIAKKFTDRTCHG